MFIGGYAYAQSNSDIIGFYNTGIDSIVAKSRIIDDDFDEEKTNPVYARLFTSPVLYDGVLGKAFVAEGYDPQYGARPLKRVVTRRIEDKLSEEILLGKVENGQRVTVDYANGDFLFIANK